MSTTVDSLAIEIQADSTSAVDGISKLTSSLDKLKKSLDSVNGLSKLTSIASAIRTVGENGSTASTNLERFAEALSKLSNLGDIKISSTIAKGISGISQGLNSLDASKISVMSSLASSLKSLNGVQDIKISSSIPNNLSKIGTAISNLQTANFSKLTQLASALKPLSQIGKVNLGSIFNQLKKLPEIASAIQNIDMNSFEDSIKRLVQALKPLAQELGEVSEGFGNLPREIRSTNKALNNFGTSSGTSKKSATDLYSSIKMIQGSVRSITNTIGDWISESNDYVENLNLFTASLGEYAEQAQTYAENVSEIMGIDPSEWLRNQGVFMTLATGFGVASDRAYTMSTQLTQLGYDLSSFFNLPFEEAMQKLEAGISGELEPLRRLGYDLSETRLKAIALDLGITQTYNDMTQAEKAQLRYYAIMTQVTSSHGDMARTLNAPANQMRILQAQVTQAARALGNIFIPVLNKVLPVCIAAAKAVRLVASAIASLFGYTLPEVDYSSITSDISSVADSIDDVGDSAGSAGKAAEELKSYLMGFDELNVIEIDDNTGSGGSGGSGTSGSSSSDWDWELPTYDFLDGLVTNKVDEWMAKIQPAVDWITEHLEGILTIITAIGAGLAAWKIASDLTTLFSGAEGSIQKWFAKNKVAVGIGLMITGVTMTVLSGYDIGYSGANLGNVLKTIIGDALIVGGSLLTFGTGPVGWAVGLGIAITATIASIVVGYKKKELEEQIKSQFGSIELTVDQITALVQKSIDQDFSSSVDLYLDVNVQLANSISSINTLKKSLDLSKWKVSIGLEMDESDTTGYKSTIDSYVSECVTYIQERGYKIDIGLQTAFPDMVDENGNTLLLGNALVTQQLTENITAIGEQLNTIFNNAFDNDGSGVLSLDEQKEVSNLLGQITDIMNVISDSKIEAELAMIDLQYGGADLTQESFDDFYASLLSTMTTMKDSVYQEVYDMTYELTANVNVAKLNVQNALEDGDIESAEYWQQIATECQNSLDLYTSQNPLQLKYDEIELQIEGMAITGLKNVYENEISKFDVDNVKTNVSDLIYECVIDKNEDSRETGKTLSKILYSNLTFKADEYFVGYLDTLIDAFGDEVIWDALSEEIQLKVYETFSDALGSEKTQWALYYAGFSMVDAISYGIDNASSIVEDSAGDIVMTLQDGTKVSLAKNDAIINLMFQELGYDIVDGLVIGVDDEMGEKAKKLADLFGIPYETAVEENEVHSPSKLFERLGGYIVDGLINGLSAIAKKLSKVWTGLPDWFKTMVNKILTIFTGMDADVGELFTSMAQDAKTPWSTVSTWFNEKVKTPITNLFTNGSFKTTGETAVSDLKKGLTSTSLPTLTPTVELVQKGWSTVSNWVSGVMGNTSVTQAVKLTQGKSAGELVWDTVSGWVSKLLGKDSVSQTVNLDKGNWSGKTIAEWCTDDSTVKMKVDLEKGNWSDKTLTQWISSSWSKAFQINLTKGNALTWNGTITGSGKATKIEFKEVGGFVQTGQMFVAREAGPELVGSIGNRTAVANNDQIVQGISGGVRDANSAVVDAINTLIEVVNAKDTSVTIGDDAIGRANDRYKVRRGINVNSGAFANSY